MHHEYSKKEEDFQQAFDELGGRLNDFVGQQILVAENKINGYGCGGVNRFVDRTLKLGILVSQFERIGDFGIVLPMSMHTLKTRRQMKESNWELISGSVTVPDYGIFNLVKNVESFFEGSGGRGRSPRFSEPVLYFAIGDEEVERYFMIAPPLKLNGSEFVRGGDPKTSGNRDTSYFDALRLLGLRVPVHLQTLPESLEESKRVIEEARARYA